jgi:hypothetical protein
MNDIIPAIKANIKFIFVIAFVILALNSTYHSLDPQFKAASHPHMPISTGLLETKGNRSGFKAINSIFINDLFAVFP